MWLDTHLIIVIMHTRQTCVEFHRHRDTTTDEKDMESMIGRIMTETEILVVDLHNVVNIIENRYLRCLTENIGIVVEAENLFRNTGVLRIRLNRRPQGNPSHQLLDRLYGHVNILKISCTIV
jgi:hypothetical protein